MKAPLLVVLASLVVAGCGASVSPERDGAVLRDAASVCRSLAAQQLRAPSVVRSGQSTPLAARLQPPYSQCEPQVTSSAAHQHSVRVCCEVSAAPPQPIVVNWDDQPATSVMEPFEEQLVIEGAPWTVLRMPADRQCPAESSTIQTVTIETDNDARVSGPRRVWARVEGTARRCSGSPAELITTSGANPIALEAQDCSLTDCDGPTSPRPFSVWVVLGTFTPGTYSVRYGANVSQQFAVR